MRHPNLAIQLSHTPLSAIIAFVAITSAYIGLGAVAIGSATSFLQIAQIGFYGTALVLFIRVLSALVGPIGAVYNGYKAYAKENPPL